MLTGGLIWFAVNKYRTNKRVRSQPVRVSSQPVNAMVTNEYYDSAHIYDAVGSSNSPAAARTTQRYQPSPLHDPSHQTRFSPARGSVLSSDYVPMKPTSESAIDLLKQQTGSPVFINPGVLDSAIP